MHRKYNWPSVVWCCLAGSDFVDTSEDLVFSSQRQICIDIPINSNDAALEGDETFVVVLTTRDVGVNISQTSALVTIIDENTITIGFEQINYTTPEEDSGNGTVLEVCVTISSVQLERNVTVFLSTSEGTATGMISQNQLSTSLRDLHTVLVMNASSVVYTFLLVTICNTIQYKGYSNSIS